MTWLLLAFINDINTYNCRPDGIIDLTVNELFQKLATQNEFLLIYTYTALVNDLITLIKTLVAT